MANTKIKLIKKQMNWNMGKQLNKENNQRKSLEMPNDTERHTHIDTHMNSTNSKIRRHNISIGHIRLKKMFNKTFWKKEPQELSLI